MKKGTLAATALAVGAGATAGSTVAQEEDEGEAVVHAHDFFPDTSFEVLTHFDTPTRDSFLENLDEDGDVFDDPSDWNVYAIRIETDGNGSPLGYLMDEETLDLSDGDTGAFSETASFRNPEHNLLEVDVTADEEADDEEDPDDEEDEEDPDDEPADENDEDMEDENDEEPNDEEPDDEENDDGILG
ncbi:calcium-binding protein [Natrialba sp. INN-245]|uniref:calcium-binding protein n=1 Tax=Natrialba sp. INN-245 TaxID=2690967 RepID=UPI00190F95D5|nr:calcium-binding protein [Natrialba sp. INN-245]